MKKRTNLILGRPLVFGDWEQIRYLRQAERMLSGELGVHYIDWELCHYWGKQTDSGKPIFHYADFDNEPTPNAVVDYIPCPRCGKKHCLLIPFDPLELWSESLIQVDEATSQFNCWSCDLPFITEERQVWVDTKNL